jgi:hypothetical protein
VATGVTRAGSASRIPRQIPTNRCALSCCFGTLRTCVRSGLSS